MLMAQEGSELFEGPSRKAQVFEGRQASRVVEDARYDLFTEDRPKRRHAQVELLADAEEAVGRAKKAGRNRVEYVAATVGRTATKTREGPSLD